ncbi:MAG: DUF4330 domain-containing protein [Clostridiales bacterium]|jgi:hypothetical protein|nr:DUF4330 domain-containing protein [Clostridiales bacterium]
MIDSDAKLFGKINIIDFVLLLALIGAVALGAYTLLRGNGPVIASGGQTEDYVLKFYVEEVEDFTAQGLNVGDNLYDDSKNLFLGVITGLDIQPAVVYNPNQNGETVKSAKEGYNSVEITTELKAQPFENGVLINGNRYGVGHSLTIRAGKSFIYLRISEVTPKSEV